MDRSLARGYSNKYLDQLTAHEDLIDWYDGPRRRKAFDAFMTSTLSKKPGRILERMRPLLAPVYRSPTVVRWERQSQLVSAIAVSSAKASSVLEFGGEDQSLFDERAVFLNNMLFSADRVRGETYAVTNFYICGHAIQRCFERALATPEALPKVVRNILQLASFVEAVFRTRLSTTTLPGASSFPSRAGRRAA